MSGDHDIREILAILSPSSVSWGATPGTSPIKLTAHDVAARLRNASRAANLLARGKYANDELSYKSYYWAFAVQVSGLPLALKISKKYPKALSKLINLTMMEMTQPSVCPWCRGKQPFTIANDKIIPCGACKGTATVIWSDRKRARLIGTPATTFTRVFAPLHFQMVGIIAGHEQEIVDALYEKQGNERNPTPPPPRAA